MDIRTVIKGLEVCVDRVPGKYTCDKCPYETHGNDCEIDLTRDAIALLKDQQLTMFGIVSNSNVKNTECAIKFQRLVPCKDCKYGKEHCSDDVLGNPLYECTNIETEDPIIHGAEWFCADGERR